MHDLSVYQIIIKDRLEENNFNAISPIQIAIEKVSDLETTFKIYSDQSGLVGLIRFLHRQGFLIFSIFRQRYVFSKDENISHEL